MGAMFDRIRSAWSDALRPAAAGHRARSPIGEDGLAAAGNLWPFEGIAPGSAGCILADPPWSFVTYNKKAGTTPHRGAHDHYATIKGADLMALPVGGLAAKHCALFMWVVDSHIPDGLALGAAWGFKFKTIAFTWRKTVKHAGASPDGFRMGMGYWTRKQSEICLLFTKGAPRRLHRGIRQIIPDNPCIDAPKREHSRKPDEQYARIEALVGGPYVELFARAQRPGWQAWGNEVGKFDA